MAMKRLRPTSAGRWWLVWVSGGRKWVLGSSKAVDAACLAVFDPSTNIALHVSRQLESAQKRRFGAIRSCVLDIVNGRHFEYHLNRGRWRSPKFVFSSMAVGYTLTLSRCDHREYGPCTDSKLSAAASDPMTVA
jgi:hypothetical protein